MSGRVALSVGAIGVVSAAAVFLSFARWEVWPKRFVELEPGLYRSGQIAPRLVRDTLAENGIEVVIDLQQPGDDAPQRAEQEAVRALGLQYERFPLGGAGTGDPTVYAQAVAAIDAAVRSGRPTLVHCSAGVRRTGGVIAMYQLLVQGRDPDAVYDELGRYADAIDEPSLLRFLNANAERIAGELVEMGVIDEVRHPIPRLGP